MTSLKRKNMNKMNEKKTEEEQGGEASEDYNE